VTGQCWTTGKFNVQVAWQFRAGCTSSSTFRTVGCSKSLLTESAEDAGYDREAQTTHQTSAEEFTARGWEFMVSVQSGLGSIRFDCALSLISFFGFLGGFFRGEFSQDFFSSACKFHIHYPVFLMLL
ncbi:MAG TPA: hypothetical protein VFO10_06930, partial [Oligoflexus sp.]|uniref:hypothetical protein n=1 Tax=Oligoflexus sp. TaxID=1971216 RepID=UPI002D8019C8